MPVTVSVALRLVSVKSSVTVPPGATGSSVNSFSKSSSVDSTVRVSVAGASVTNGPPNLAELSIVTLPYSSSKVSTGTVSVTLTCKALRYVK